MIFSPDDMGASHQMLE